jgi:hypothetical protein
MQTKSDGSIALFQNLIAPESVEMIAPFPAAIQHDEML